MARSATSQSTGLPLLSPLYEPPPKHLISVLGGPDQPIETRALQAQTPQAHPTGPHVGPHQLGRADQAMQEGQTGDAVKKRDDRGTRGAALWVRLPCLPRGARPGKPLGGVPRGEARGFARVRRRQEGRALEALPTLVAILVAAWRLGDDRAHRALLGPCFACGVVMAKEGEGAWWFHPFVVSSLCLAGTVR